MNRSIGSWVDPRQTMQLQHTAHIDVFQSTNTLQRNVNTVYNWIQCPHVLITVCHCDFVFVNSVVVVDSEDSL